MAKSQGVVLVRLGFSTNVTAWTNSGYMSGWKDQTEDSRHGEKIL